MIPVAKLNHAVLYVRDAGRRRLLPASWRGRLDSSTAGRVHARRAATTTISACSRSGRRLGARGSTGLYHLAWEVPTIEDLARLPRAGVGPRGASDHGVSKSLYGSDPDGNEFEIMWRSPRPGASSKRGTVMPLDIDAEVRRWGAAGAPGRLVGGPSRTASISVST